MSHLYYVSTADQSERALIQMIVGFCNIQSYNNYYDMCNNIATVCELTLKSWL